LLHFAARSAVTSLYFPDASGDETVLLTGAAIAVLADGAAMFALTWLRMREPGSRTPYLRVLMFPCAAIYLLVIGVFSTQATIDAMIIGNVVVAAVIITWAIRRR